ncbi:hypothetical protein CTAYLR_010621 [Chrysophaeum taylorii]|uniref:Uncharacterized protein n=1 Tax=Chrysophaeum taylorii TaxID=2483200 RepID=A0AAD7XK52_9STRA|nr:hypothetical protein CTAYLR_010621 [Chrysophaeum taylorii]
MCRELHGTHLENTWPALPRIRASRTVIIWRTFGEWNIEAELSIPFKDAIAQTFFQRLSWSPDGLSLGVPNAAKAQQQVSDLAWSTDGALLVASSHDGSGS